MKARIISYSVDGELSFKTVASCEMCYYGSGGHGLVSCCMSGEDICGCDDPENCPFPTVLAVLVAKGD